MNYLVLHIESGTFFPNKKMKEKRHDIICYALNYANDYKKYNEIKQLKFIKIIIIIKEIKKQKKKKY